MSVIKKNEGELMTSVAKPKKKLGLGKLIFVLLFIVAVVGCIWSYYQYDLAKKEIANLKDLTKQQEIAKQEVVALVVKISKMMILPNEEPVLATILDVEKLVKDQPFYQDAQNGDKILIYQKAQKAVIYSPMRNIIVNVGPVYTDKSVVDNQAANPPVNQLSPAPVKP